MGLSEAGWKVTTTSPGAKRPKNHPTRWKEESGVSVLMINEHGMQTINRCVLDTYEDNTFMWVWEGMSYEREIVFDGLVELDFLLLAGEADDSSLVYESLLFDGGPSITRLELF